MSLGTILLIILIIFLLGGFSGRFGGYGYGYGHRGVGVLGIVDGPPDETSERRLRRLGGGHRPARPPHDIHVPSTGKSSACAYFRNVVCSAVRPTGPIGGTVGKINPVAGTRPG